MKILPVSDPSFAPYGRIVEGYDVKGILDKNIIDGRL